MKLTDTVQYWLRCPTRLEDSIYSRITHTRYPRVNSLCIVGESFSISDYANERLARQRVLSGMFAVSAKSCCANIIQLIAILLLGFFVFPPMSFFIALYFQQVSKYSALMTAVHLLPMAVSGVLVNVGFPKWTEKVENTNTLFLGRCWTSFTYGLQQVVNGHRS